MRDAFVERLTILAVSNPRIFLIIGDLGFGVLTDFAKKYPSQFLNVGVAEQNMIGVATGLALEGRTVFVYSIGNFPNIASANSFLSISLFYSKSTIKFHRSCAFFVS